MLTRMEFTTCHMPLGSVILNTQRNVVEAEDWDQMCIIGVGRFWSLSHTIKVRELQ
jgi:hypothetical protein